MKKHLSWTLAMLILVSSTTPTMLKVYAQENDAQIEDVEVIETIDEDNQEQESDLDIEEGLDLDKEETEDTSDEDKEESNIEDDIEEGTIKIIVGDTSAYTADGILEMREAPLVIEGSTYVELKFVVEELINGTTVWDDETRATTITKDEKSVTIKNGDDTAIINGQIPVMMPGAPITIDGVMMVPLRFLMDEFSIALEYNDVEKSITLINTQEPPIAYDPPVAEFNFPQNSYVAGQYMSVRDTSYDESGFQIVERMWMIDNDPNRTGSSFNQLFSNPKPGVYTISLKVKNEKGVWSDWYEQELEILENQAPVITKFEPRQKTFKPGEKIWFDYEYDNEGWEEIVNIKWTYRSVDDTLSQRVFMRPGAIFNEGEYVVTLQLEDAYGNLSEVEETIVTVKGDEVRSEFDQKFSYPIPGEIIDNFEDFNYRDYTPDPTVERSTNEEMLVMSDSPEVVTDLGILYREEIDGSGRILLHHLNGFSEYENSQSNKYVVMTATNTTDEAIQIELYNKEVKSSVTDALYIGQRLLEDYLKGGTSKTYTVQPGETIYIYNEPTRRWTTDEVMSGMMDFRTTGPLTLEVAAIDEHIALEDIKHLPILDKDIHPRGTFPVTEISYSVNIGTDEPTKLILGERGSDDIVAGTDGITGEDVINTGNFGIMYSITVTAEEDTGIFINPRGGMLQGAIRWDDGSVHLVPETGPIPAHNRAAVIGVVKAGETRTFEYMLPNGSSAPVLIGFVPKSHW